MSKILSKVKSMPKNALLLFLEFPGKLRCSAREMKDLYSLVGIAMLLALSIVLDAFSIYITESLKIGVGFLITALLGMLYGPVAGAAAAGVADVLKYILKPMGPFFPGYTLSAMLGAFIYGFFFYKCRTSITRCVFSKLLINFFLNALLGTYWSTLLYGKVFVPLFVTRFTKNMIMLPIEIVLLFLVTVAAVSVVQRLPSKRMRRTPK